MLKSILIFAVLLISSSAFLWRIERSPPAYIFGTMHVPYDRIWPYVSNETRQAFVSSTHFYGEVDVTDDYWKEFLQCIMRTSNRTQRSIRSMKNEELLDVHLSVEARLLNKTVGSLESAEYNCQREGHRYSISAWIFMVYILREEIRKRSFSVTSMNHNHTKSVMKKYLCETLDSRYIHSLVKSRDSLRHLEERDEHMAGFIHRLLQSSNDHRYFFAVGIGHMLIECQNLFVRLESLGYRITRVCPKHADVRKNLGCRKKKTLQHCIKNT